MTIEIANFIHASVLFLNDDPPVIYSSSGLRAVNPVTRVGPGHYQLHLAQAIRSNVLGGGAVEVQGGVLATSYFGGLSNAQMIDARIDDADNSIVVAQMRDNTETLTDGGILQVIVFRLPTVD